MFEHDLERLTIDPPKPPLLHVLIPVIILFALTSLILLIILGLTHLTTRPSRKKTAIVLVYGDIARSPRMTYHAQSLSSHKYQVHYIGYTDTSLPPTLTENNYIRIHGLTNPEIISSLPWALRAPLRVIWQSLEVAKICLWDIEVNASVMFVQNPPSIPTLGVVKIVGWGSGCKVVLDWHNTGWSILALRVGQKSPLVKIARWYVFRHIRLPSIIRLCELNLADRLQVRSYIRPESLCSSVCDQGCKGELDLNMGATVNNTASRPLSLADI
jgi:hypothetical protein